jgi:hypothetical protein
MPNARTRHGLIRAWVADRESLVDFNLSQPFTSWRIGHRIRRFTTGNKQCTGFPECFDRLRQYIDLRRTRNATAFARNKRSSIRRRIAGIHRQNLIRLVEYIDDLGRRQHRKAVEYDDSNQSRRLSCGLVRSGEARGEGKGAMNRLHRGLLLRDGAVARNAQRAW